MPKLSPSAIEKNKSRIEEAAKKLFIKQGFHATSMRNIAARAGPRSATSITITGPTCVAASPRSLKS
jgi:AcrR family transcriptional regulator